MEYNVIVSKEIWKKIIILCIYVKAAKINETKMVGTIG